MNINFKGHEYNVNTYNFDFRDRPLCRLQGAGDARTGVACDVGGLPVTLKNARVLYVRKTPEGFKVWDWSDWGSSASHEEECL